jgi:ubiquinone/menaquinone biosynthesis C-methylase UbiE
LTSNLLPVARDHSTDADFIARVPSGNEIRHAYDWWSPFYDAIARPRETGARRWALSRLRIPGHADVLDAGIGSGGFVRDALADGRREGRLVGIDVSRPMLRMCRRRVAEAASVSLAQSDAVALPFRDASFDWVLSSYLLDLLPFGAIDTALHEFWRVLRPGGAIALVNLTRADDGRDTWYERFYRALPSTWAAFLLGGCRPVNLENAVRRSGFEDVQRSVVDQGLCSEVIVGRKVVYERARVA